MSLDLAFLQKNYQLIEDTEEKNFEDKINEKWENKLVQRYNDKLYKEFAISFLSKCNEGKIGIRWRTEQEVISGKGEYVCSENQCTSVVNLKPYEVHFKYQKESESKETLVKLILCDTCSEKLKIYYKSLKKKKKKKRKHKDKKKKKKSK